MAKRKKAVREAPKAKARKVPRKRSRATSAAKPGNELAEVRRELAEARARQAATAIENAWLVAEVQTKIRELDDRNSAYSEQMDHQSATTEILKAMSASPGNSQPVFDVIIQRALRICDADIAVLLEFDGALVHLRSIAVDKRSASPGVVRAYRNIFPQPPSRNSVALRAIFHGKVIHIPNMADDRELSQASRDIGRKGAVAVPLIRDGKVIGSIGLSAKVPGGFSKVQIRLLQTFADQAVIAIENARLFKETKEALEQQKASADILNVISNSVADTQPVFDKILQSIQHLFGGEDRLIFLAGEDGLLHIGAAHGDNADRVRTLFPVPLLGTATEMAMRERRLVAYSDVLNDPGVPAGLRQTAYRFGASYSTAIAPLLWEDRGIGSIQVARSSMVPFNEKECDLLRTFADQAVIAIQNARLFNETKEALERQTATADILKVIASSPSDTQPVFDAIAERSKRLVDARSTTVFRLEDGVMYLKAFSPINPEADATLKAGFPASLANFSWGEAIRRGDIHRVLDTEQEIESMRELARLRGFRSMLFVPLLRDGTPIGVIAVTRVEPGPFVEHHVQLLQTFADQAVIAIENTRLFNEVQTKSRDIEEALRYQTGSANILNVIASSPTDVQPVLKAIVECACELCEAHDAVVLLKDGDDLCFRAHHGPIPINTDRWPIGRAWASGRAVIDRATVHVHDIYADDDFTDGRELSRRAGSTAVRSILAAPLLREGKSIGAILLRRQEVRPFNDKQIAMLQTFADQAVIAIRNVELFDEVQARTRELSKSLDDLRTAQDRLVQTEKLASLGQLTAGIAHEIKNPLNFVNNFAALSAELVDELDQTLVPAPLDQEMRGDVGELTRMLKSNLERVVQHGKRADSIVKNMLQHSREGSGERRSADINALVGESLNLAYHGARAEKPGFSITIKHDLDPDAGALELYPQEITRALLNLISNGFYAAAGREAETDGGAFEPILSATTRNLGEMVEIRIRDNGSGIPPDVREKMFNPFFTTKPTGEGTGLGLSMTHDIVVKQHGGRIDVETEPGTFTEFIVTLPRGNAARSKPE